MLRMSECPPPWQISFSVCSTAEGLVPIFTGPLSLYDIVRRLSCSLRARLTRVNCIRA